jgi:putative sterol carrier protein
MAIMAFTDEFAQAYKDEINNSEAYRQAGKGWKWTVALIAEAEPDKNFPESKAMYLDLFDGQAREVKLVSPEEASKCDFVISAPYSRWKQVMKKELDPTRGMMQGKLKLRGDLPTIIRYQKAAREMVECVARLPLIFPDEQ